MLEESAVLYIHQALQLRIALVLVDIINMQDLPICLEF